MFKKATLAEWQRFVRLHPSVRVLEVLLPDLLGILRGKKLIATEIAPFFLDAISLPLSIYTYDTLGRVCTNLPYSIEDGDPDFKVFGHSDTLTVGAVNDNSAQVFAYMETADNQVTELDSRHILQKIITDYQDDGLAITTGTEIEFYLLQKSKVLQKDGSARRITTADSLVSLARSNSIGDLDDSDPFFEEVISTALKNDIKIQTIVSETGPGQFELSLAPLNDALKACDNLVLTKKILKNVAHKHGLIACFLAKTFSQESGSGMHFHISLSDIKSGKNILAGNKMPRLGTPCSNKALYAIAGLLKTMDECTALFAPNANSYRRFKVGSFAPINRAWGSDNRTVAIRLPKASEKSARIEHRIAGSDANPYLCMAAILMGIKHGLDSKIAPPPYAVGNAYREKKIKTIPRYWSASLDKFLKSKLIAEQLGKKFHYTYHKNREFECNSFHTEVEKRDFDWYLHAV